MTETGWSIEEQSNSHLRWEVYGPIFGRETLRAAFLTEQEAQEWAEQMEARERA